jgi:hypothetical protein
MKGACPKWQIFISHFVFRSQPAEFFSSNKNCQMKVGQNNKYEIRKALELTQVCG